MKASLASSLLLLALLPSTRTAPGQSAGEGAAAFPQNLLEGRDDFTLAMQFQSDARGNVGPCG